MDTTRIWPKLLQYLVRTCAVTAFALLEVQVAAQATPPQRDPLTPIRLTREELEELLDRPVDVVTVDGLREPVRSAALRDAVPI